MSEKKLFWTLDSFSTDCAGVKVNPILMMKKKLPYKLLYTKGKKIQILEYPLVNAICEIFHKESEIASEEYYAIGYLKNGAVEIITESRFYLEIQFSRYKIIQAARDLRLQTYTNKIDFKFDHYNSYLYQKKKDSKVLYDDLSIEKALMKFTSSIISSIENTRKFYIESIELSFFLNRQQDCIFECPVACCISNSFKDRSICRFPLVMYSRQLKTNNSLIHRNFSEYKLRKVVLKPKIRISQSKLFDSLSLFPEINKQSETLFYCRGSYCDLLIFLISITKKRKVPYKRYEGIHHELVKQVIESINFPLSEREFDEEFDRKYEAKLFQRFLNKETALDNKQGKVSVNQKDMIILCTVCYKVFNNAFLKEAKFKA